MTITRLLRVLLVVAAGLAVGVLMVHWLSLDVAKTYPEVAHLRAPAFWAAVVRLVPLVLAARAMWRFLAFVDRGKAFSVASARLVRQVSVVCLVLAVYIAVAAVVLGGALPQSSPTFTLAVLGAESVALFLMAACALLGRLLREAGRPDVRTGHLRYGAI